MENENERELMEKKSFFQEQCVKLFVKLSVVYFILWSLWILISWSLWILISTVDPLQALLLVGSVGIPMFFAGISLFYIFLFSLSREEILAGDWRVIIFALFWFSMNFALTQLLYKVFFYNMLMK